MCYHHVPPGINPTNLPYCQAQQPCKRRDLVILWEGPSQHLFSTSLLNCGNLFQTSWKESPKLLSPVPPMQLYSSLLDGIRSRTEQHLLLNFLGTLRLALAIIADKSKTVAATEFKWCLQKQRLARSQEAPLSDMFSIPLCFIFLGCHAIYSELQPRRHCGCKNQKQC